MYTGPLGLNSLSRSSRTIEYNKLLIDPEQQDGCIILVYIQKNKLIWQKNNTKDLTKPSIFSEARKKVKQTIVIRMSHLLGVLYLHELSDDQKIHFFLFSVCRGHTRPAVTACSSPRWPRCNLIVARNTIKSTECKSI